MLVTFVVWLFVLFMFGRYVPEDTGFVTRSLSEGSIPHYISDFESDIPVKGWENVTHLVMVAGHTIFIGSDYGEADVNESHWYSIAI